MLAVRGGVFICRLPIEVALILWGISCVLRQRAEVQQLWLFRGYERRGGILEVLGGVGLFLLGMAVMTQGLQSLAGESLRSTLTRFTKTPLTGTLSGMVVTALVQSSGATTVMAVGFVGAGLLSFPQALGIIFGANIGTTATGWIVALWGFTFSLRSIALPMLFIGSMLRVFGSKYSPKVWGDLDFEAGWI